ncbi:MAG: HAD-IB family hydrolase [Acidimicrobiia bacterium]
MSPRVVAAFDLDRTLTRRETLVPFVLRARGRAATVRTIVALPLPLARGLARDSHRDHGKELFLERLLGGREVAPLAAAAEAFAGDVVAAHLRPDTHRQLEWHRAQGHELVIISASPELYVAPIGRRLGVDAVLATRLEVDAQGRFTGRFTGRNCRGAEKAVRLRDHLGAGGPVTTLFAYGDSKGDRELLAMASTGVWVGRRPLPDPGALLAGE